MPVIKSMMIRLSFATKQYIFFVKRKSLIWFCLGGRMATDTMGMLPSDVDSTVAQPLHVQRMEKALSLDPLLAYVENIIHTTQR